jgi:hypothetical protein
MGALSEALHDRDGIIKGAIGKRGCPLPKRHVVVTRTCDMLTSSHALANRRAREKCMILTQQACEGEVYDSNPNSDFKNTGR